MKLINADLQYVYILLGLFETSNIMNDFTLPSTAIDSLPTIGKVAKKAFINYVFEEIIKDDI